MRIKRTDKHTQTSFKKKHLFNVIDDSSDDDKVNDKEDFEEVNNSVDSKTEEKDKHVEKVNKKSNPHVHHLDDFSDDGHLLDKKHTSFSKENKYTLVDEETDEDFNELNNTSDEGVWVNINDLPWSSNYFVDQSKYIDDEADEDLQNADIHSV